MVKHAWGYRWSSIHEHLTGVDPLGLVSPAGHLKYADTGDWKEYILAAQDTDTKELMQHQRTGRPLGSEAFVENVGRILGRDLKKKKPGPKVKQGN